MVAAASFAILDGGVATAVGALVDGDRVLIEPGDLQAATGWERKPEGLCRGAVCVPVREPDLEREGRIDLAAFARALRRPLAVDVDARVAALGTAVAQHRDGLGALQAPEFALPDLSGTIHRLSQWRGRKVLLAAYASW
jgi:hypothetical protein